MQFSTTISAEEFGQLLARSSSQELQLIDVRSPIEYRSVHLEFARNVPLSDLRQWAKEYRGETSKPIYVICQSGQRSERGRQQLADLGWPQVVSIAGGMAECQRAGIPVQSGRKTMSLERQVRIAAGAIVFTGVSLGFWWNPYFLAIPAFVGAGLVFAGITDTCGMALLLARMPWNR